MRPVWAAVLLFAFGLNVAQGQIAQSGYVGVVAKSATRKAGEQFTFANLRTARPFVTYPSGSGAELTKVFEDTNVVVLVFVASATGSTETYYLNKTKKTFTLVEVGVIESIVMGNEFRPDVSHGSLK